MLKKTAISLGLATVAASGTAAQGDVAASAPTGHVALSAQFEQLDTNGNGMLSRREAKADPKVAPLYDSLDTSATIEDSARNTQPGGITLEQFESGMQAQQRGGTVGPSASGGETYRVYPDGSREKVEDAGVPAPGDIPGSRKP